MPEIKITSARIRDHLRRLWFIYLAGAVALLFLNNLVYTVTRPSFSDDETLKVMLLNAELSISEEDLLNRVQHLGFRAAELQPLAAAGDPAGEMLLMVQLTGGFGDIYICDSAGMDALSARDACLPLSGDTAAAAEALAQEKGLYIAVMVNGTDTGSALAALPILAEMILE